MSLCNWYLSLWNIRTSLTGEYKDLGRVGHEAFWTKISFASKTSRKMEIAFNTNRSKNDEH
jgi:hypothetical protein